MSKEITSKTKRIAEILRLLEQGTIEIPDLADRFGVSTRTLQRDIKLICQTKIPVLDIKQSVYAFAKGFSLAKVGLTPEKTALLLTSFDIAKQIGPPFKSLLKEINLFFEPQSFEGCNFNPSEEDIAQLGKKAEDLFEATKYHYILTISKIRVYPYKLISILDKWYLISAKDGEINRLLLEDISNYRFTTVNENIQPKRKRKNPPVDTTNAKFQAKSFDASPFKDWEIWQQAHIWVNEVLRKAELQAQSISESLSTELEKTETSVKIVENPHISKGITIQPAISISDEIKPVDNGAKPIIKNDLADIFTEDFSDEKPVSDIPAEEDNKKDNSTKESDEIDDILFSDSKKRKENIDEDDEVEEYLDTEEAWENYVERTYWENNDEEASDSEKEEEEYEDNEDETPKDSATPEAPETEKTPAGQSKDIISNNTPNTVITDNPPTTGPTVDNVAVNTDTPPNSTTESSADNNPIIEDNSATPPTIPTIISKALNNSYDDIFSNIEENNTEDKKQPSLFTLENTDNPA